jgi:hypothetical protein
MNPLKILLIENDQTVARRVRAALDDAKSGSLELECVSEFGKNRVRPRRRAADVDISLVAVSNEHGEPESVALSQCSGRQSRESGGLKFTAVRPGAVRSLTDSVGSLILERCLHRQFVLTA